MKNSLVLATVIAAAALVACGKKEEAPVAAPAVEAPAANVEINTTAPVSVAPEAAPAADASAGAADAAAAGAAANAADASADAAKASEEAAKAAADAAAGAATAK